MNLPMTFDDVTPAWLSMALSLRWPGVEVSSVRSIDSISGTATKLHLELEYTHKLLKAGKTPATVFIKYGTGDFQWNKVAEMGLYSNEVFAYTRMLPKNGPFDFGFARPDCYFGKFQKKPIQGVLLLEDLLAADVFFNVATEPISVSRAAKAMEALAELHGKSWECEALEPVQPVLSHQLDLYTKEVKIAPKLFKLLRGYVVPLRLQNQQRYSEAWSKYVKFIRTGPQCLLHGDAHFGNSYSLKDGRVGLHDWQLISKGRWAHDVAYYLISALDVADRRRSERDLLGHYLYELRKYGVRPPSFIEAWDDYRKAALYSLVVWLGNPNLCQSPEINLVCLARTAAALDDLDTYGAYAV